MLKLFGGGPALKMGKKVKAFMNDYMTKHIKNFDKAEKNNMMDVMIEKNLTETDETSSFFGEMGRENILKIFQDFFIAGMETTSSTLIWTFLYLLHYPDVQEKVHKEIVRVRLT